MAYTKETVYTHSEKPGSNHCGLLSAATLARRLASAFAEAMGQRLDSGSGPDRLPVSQDVSSLVPTPDPVPAGYLRGLIAAAGISQQEAARRLHVDPATLRRWLSPPTRASHRACPWAAAELLRRIVADQAE
jgi:DNA-binding transcriptional regulator YiaG